MSATMAVWAVTYLLHSTLLIGLVWTSARFIRSASVRDTLWKVALCGGIVTATVQVAVPIDAIAPEAVPARVTFDRSALESIVALEPAVAPATQAEFVKAASPVLDLSGPALAFSAWLLIAFGLLLRIVVGHGRFLSAVGDRVELVRGPERDRLDRLCRRAGVRRPVRLTQSVVLGSPVAMLGREIVIPARAFDRMSEAQKDTILAHELGHVVRRDPLWLTVGEVAKAVLFFQPLNWIVQAKAKETAEFLCDDAAVLQTGHPEALAETLAELAAHPVPAPPAVAAMAEGGSNLMLRVTRMLHSHPVAPLALGVRLALAAAVVVTTVLFAPGMVAGDAGGPRKLDGTFSRFAEGTLSQTFRGPEGRTHVQFDAREAEIDHDGRTQRLGRGGFVRATQTSVRGPKREIEIVRGAGDELVHRYRVDGVDKDWCEDARMVIVAAFRGQKTYPEQDPERRSERIQTGRKHWGADVELTGTRDGVPTYLSVRANDLWIDFDAGTVAFEPGGKMDVVERDGPVEKTFHMDADGKRYGGDLDPGEKKAWLTRVLKRQTALPDHVIDELAD